MRCIKKGNRVIYSSQSTLSADIDDWVEMVGEKNKGRIYGLGSQAYDYVSSEFSNQTSSQPPQQCGVESRVTTLSGMHVLVNIM